MPEIRLAVIRRLAEALADNVHRDDASLELEEAFAEATTAEKQVVADAFAQSAVASLRDAGVLRDPPTVLDATNRQLRAVAAVWAVLSRWDCSLNMDKRLGDELKVLPASDVEVIHQVLVQGGLLAPEVGDG
jgi:hypothetical protein